MHLSKIVLIAGLLGLCACSSEWVEPSYGVGAGPAYGIGVIHPY